MPILCSSDITCACRDIVLGIPTDAHIRYCLDFARALDRFAIVPIFVFHGRTLKLLEEAEEDRKKERERYLKCAMAKDWRYDSHRSSYKFYRKAFDIASVAPQLIKALDDNEIAFLVAPYDANAQLSYLCKKDIVQTVITDDPSLIMFGCPSIIFHWTQGGFGYEWNESKMLEYKKGCTHYSGLSLQQLLNLGLLGSCNYVPFCSEPIDFARPSFKIVETYDTVKEYISNAWNGDPVVMDRIRKAYLAYRYQRVYDPFQLKLTHLNDVPNEILNSSKDDFLGLCLTDEVGKLIAYGNIDPTTMESYKFEKDHGNQEAETKKPKLDTQEIFNNKRNQIFKTSMDLYIFYDEGEDYHYFSTDSEGEYNDDAYDFDIFEDRTPLL